MTDVGRHPLIELLAYSEVKQVTDIGNAVEDLAACTVEH